MLPGTSCENLMMYGGLYQHTRVVLYICHICNIFPYNPDQCDASKTYISNINSIADIKVKSCYNPLRLGTVIVLVSSGIDFVNTPRLYSDQATLVALYICHICNIFPYNPDQCDASKTYISNINWIADIKVKSCYNPLRLGTVIVLVSSGIDFVNTPRLYSDQATR